MSGNGNNWIQIACIGTSSNKSAIGAKIRVKATIGGNVVWQVRQVSSLTGFFSQNSLDSAFGLGNAASIDEIRIEWPSAQLQMLFSISPNQILTVQEPELELSPESIADPYYLYSFDGKLMAEYDDNSNCLKNYIYAGNRLVAEYRPQENKYYYYTPDQINSTRMITDDTGTVVYSATFDPFGGIQKTWVNTYDPALKFSGKEREPSNDMDYFGARYYAHTRYRWTSPDLVIKKNEALSNPQLLNLYSYSRNNPLSYIDPNGETEININAFRLFTGNNSIIGSFFIAGTNISGYTLELPWRDNKQYVSCIPGSKSYPAYLDYASHFNNPWILRIPDSSTPSREGILMHEGYAPEQTWGCILPGKGADVKNERLSESGKILSEITNYVKAIFILDTIFNHEITKININIYDLTPIVGAIKSAAETAKK